MANSDETVTATGGCLCGSVRYEVRGKLRPVIACHCTQCRRQTGHFLASTAVRYENFRLVKDEDVRWYEASDIARRGFCVRCGSMLFWAGNGRPHLSIAAGTIDGETGLRTAVHIHTADKGDYYDLADGVPQVADGDYSSVMRREV